MQFLSVVPFLVPVLKEWLRIPMQIGGEKGGGVQTLHMLSFHDRDRNFQNPGFLGN